MKEKIEQFIKDNHLSFGIGRRNSTITILIGYSLFLGIEKEFLKTYLEEQIKADKFIQEEIDRLWSFCVSSHYEKFWLTKDAKKIYKF